VAGLGRKVWTQETLSVPDMQGYLQDQVVMRFTNAAQRDAAIPVPAEGMFVTLDDTDVTYRHDGTRWRRVFGPATGVLGVDNAGTGAVIGPNTNASVQVTQNVAAHDAGVLELEIHATLTCTNIFAGYLGVGIGAAAGSQALIGTRTRLHNNGQTPIFTSRAAARYTSDGTAKVMSALLWNDAGSTSTDARVWQASFQVYLR
jgi:hypothetical protein